MIVIFYFPIIGILDYYKLIGQGIKTLNKNIRMILYQISFGILP